VTHRDRVVDTLLCKSVDRPPFPEWLGFIPWDSTLARWKGESGIADLDISRYFGFEPFFACPSIEYGPFPHFEEKVLGEDGEFVISVDYRGITVRNRRDGASMPEWIDHPVKDPRGWEGYKRGRLQGPIELRLEKLDEFAAEVRRMGAPVQVGGFPWGAFGTLRDILGAEECLLAFYDYPEMVRDIIDTHVGLWLQILERIVGKVRVDAIHIWEDMSGKQGSLISMAMLEEYLMPSYDRIVGFARAHRIPIVSVDSDGQVEELVPAMMRHGINAFMPFEVQAGNDVVEYRRKYATLGIMGGLDKSALAKTRREIHRELDRAQRMFSRGGWIAGFDHAIPPDVPWRNYEYAVKEIRRMIFGP
jgi:uroporphyrinogen decarboxylase